MDTGHKPNEYINTVFTMEHHHHHNHQQKLGCQVEVAAPTNEINLRPLTSNSPNPQTVQFQNQEINKTAPFEPSSSSQRQRNDEIATSCECLAHRFGMDAERLSKFYSLFLALLATVALTFSIFLVKLSHSLNASQMGTVKFSTQLMLCFPFAYFYRQSLLGPKGSRRWLLARGLAGALSILAAYFSIKMINFGDSMAIRYSSPIVTTIFARFFLKQHIKMVKK